MPFQGSFTSFSTRRCCDSQNMVLFPLGTSADLLSPSLRKQQHLDGPGSNCQLLHLASQFRAILLGLDTSSRRRSWWMKNKYTPLPIKWFIYCMQSHTPPFSKHLKAVSQNCQTKALSSGVFVAHSFRTDQAIPTGLFPLRLLDRRGLLRTSSVRRSIMSTSSYSCRML